MGARFGIARIVSIFVLLLAVSPTVWCATLNVTNAAGCSDTTGRPYCTINAAIVAAASGDTIQIAAGTYAGNITAFSKSLTFIGAGSTTSGTVITKPVTYSGVGPLSISNVRISSANSNLKLNGTGNFSGLTLSDDVFVGNGNADHGVFIKQNGTVSNVTVTNCTSTNHGQSGMLIQPGTGAATAVDHVTVTGSTFDTNGEYGLRIDPHVTALTVSISSLTNNAIDGLVLLDASGVTLTNLTITGNRNGILLIPLVSPQAISNITMTNVYASSNTKFISGQFGSGLNLTGTSGPISQISVTGSTFSSNGIHGVVTAGAVSQVTIDCGVIAGNVQEGIHEVSSPSAQLVAKHVYWGCSTGPNTAGCSTVSGNVAFLPFRTSATATCTPHVDLAISKAAAPEPVATGGSLTYTLSATNNGPDPATGVILTDALPSAVTFMSASSGCSLSGSTVTCIIGDLAVSAQATRTIAVTAPPSPGTITNTATVNGNETPDTNPANNSASFTSHVQSAVSLTRIAIFSASVSLTPNESFQLTATAYYSNATMQNVTSQASWSTSAGGVATVNATGLVTGIGQGSATITATFGGMSGAATAQVETLPPDAASVATPIDPTKITTVADSTSFLYTGANPIQTGVAAGTIARVRAAVIRGKVLSGSGLPLRGVHVTILNHPEYGRTMTRADGMFDLAVNGGGPLTVHFDKGGYIPADRDVTPNWNDYATAETVTMIGYDPTAFLIDLTAPGMKVARGSMLTDADGTRTATMLFPSGTTATMTLPNGSTQPLSSLTVRATEFTVGPNGPSQMPAKLPAQSGYTYCVELTADEALAAGATQLNFSQPVPFYVDNFLGASAGMIVPAGFYDRANGGWVGMENAIVVKIVAITGGRASLDITGDDIADDTDTIIGTTPAERDQLATLYGAGRVLWRQSLSHFTAIDMNFFGRLQGTGGFVGNAPSGDWPQYIPTPDDCHGACGSVIEVEAQTLGEELPVTGTPYHLHYRTSRVPGRRTDFDVPIRLSSATIPNQLKRIDLVVDCAGTSTTVTFPAAANQSTVFAWNGKDAYGRTVQGKVPVTVTLRYIYDDVYMTFFLPGVTPPPPAWAQPVFFGNGFTISATTRVIEEPRASAWSGTVGNWDARAAGLGGWTFTEHHTYD
ncbi:MAG: right-handed parallel beta-helix repeat-containing protein, partial [Acidobacteriota bacterium]|nr:right-handed parallel beta-helix repeat-containing protein [Acidobacteriota bacterium]